MPRPSTLRTGSGAAGRVTAPPEATNPSTSRRVIRPPVPVPDTCARSTRCSAARRRTTGDSIPESPDDGRATATSGAAGTRGAAASTGTAMTGPGAGGTGTAGRGAGAGGTGTAMTGPGAGGTGTAGRGAGAGGTGTAMTGPGAGGTGTAGRGAGA